jgi:A/G-specific adenine glycosylase
LIIEANGHSIDSVSAGNQLLQWGPLNFRCFPWRTTNDPYKILMSEVMLHRTQAIQVVPVYKNFIDHYPDSGTLSKASIAELHGILYPLGLRWRIDLIHKMAADLIDKWKGHVPFEKSDLLSLPGVSDYISGAVRCFAWNQPEPLADTNTVRVIGRLFGLHIKDSSRRNRLFKELLVSLIHLDEPRQYNYALLDLADKICKKKTPPECHICPLQNLCQTGLSRLASES